ncbi:transglycosylase family protein [Streptomyces sp. DH37]|uniref:transglycosylase family protein n=1 Tax=Streptomyces sp. DH37 TaxID=3040122 RepID=UPI0024428F86|nr:transglycosylase family protein [Streptomyces sp. DH37]MDG9703119.1 transglycosylase family protein [Streptomyces sp. DH37]
MPLLGASGAQAADLDTWDRVAQCESGGLWSADTGNGYYGGLQLTQETWERYGGTAYAKRPDLASRSQQIAVAEKILADQGPDAWPSCGVNAGLRHDTTGEAPAIDPDNLLPEEDAQGGEGDRSVGDGLLPTDGAPTGDVPDDDGRDSPAAGKDGGTGGDAEAGGADAEPGAGAAPKAGTGGGERASEDARGEDVRAEDGGDDASGAEVPEGTGKHRGERDPRELAPEERTGGQPSEGQEAVGGERSEEAADRAGRAGRSALARSVSGLGVRAADEGYLVRPGDSLVTIARENEVRGGWSGLYESNKDVVGEDPDLILPGQELTLG